MQISSHYNEGKNAILLPHPVFRVSLNPKADKSHASIDRFTAATLRQYLANYSLNPIAIW